MDLFGEDCEEVFAIHFDKVLESERPKDTAELLKSSQALQRMKEVGRKLDLKKTEVMDMDSLFCPEPDSKVKDLQEERDQKRRPVQFPAYLVKRFIEYSFPKDPNETMAWITGHVVNDKKRGTQTLTDFSFQCRRATLGPFLNRKVPTQRPSNYSNIWNRPKV